jgi:hypothetical protein
LRESERDRLYGLVVRIPGYKSRGPGFDTRRYHILWEVVGLERGLLSLMRITEELLEWRSNGSGSRKPRLTAMGICCTDHTEPSIRKMLALASPTSGGRSVGIVHLWAEAMEFSLEGKWEPHVPADVVRAGSFKTSPKSGT